MSVQRITHIKVPVAESSDDGREVDSATWFSKGNTSNVITFGNFGGQLHTGAFRFRDVHIPKEAKVVFARIRVRPASTDLVDPNVKLLIKGIKEADTKPFDSSSRPSQRSKTVNSTAWNIIKKWEAHEWVQSPNLKLIIEEIVAQSGWKQGNSLALVIQDNTSDSNQAETCWDRSKGDGYQAELEVWFGDYDTQVTIGTIAANDRDGNEDDTGAWSGSPAGNVMTMGNDGSHKYTAGFIFSGISIPHRSQIMGAMLLLINATQNNRFPNIMIRGIAEDNAALFSTDGSNKPSTRTKTAAQKEWTIGESVNGTFVGIHWSAESVYESPDLAEIVQEIIDRDGWVPGNKIGLALENYFSWSGQYKLPWDYVKDTGAYSARLVIAWKQKRTRQSAMKDIPRFEKANYPAYIVVHHTATPRDATHFQTIQNNHKGIGWGDIGYHHWISGALDGDGLHIPGRPENKIGAHADTNKMNYRSIAIVVCGDFQPTAGNESPSAAQLETLQTLLDEIRKERGIPKERVLGHREVPAEATNCPGDHLLTCIERYRATGKLQ